MVFCLKHPMSVILLHDPGHKGLLVEVAEVKKDRAVRSIFLSPPAFMMLF